MKLKLQYYWHRISGDGLIKGLKSEGPYYHKATPECGPFDTEHEALYSLEKWMESYEFYDYTEMVLMRYPSEV